MSATLRIFMASVVVLIAGAAWWFSMADGRGCYPWQDAVKPEPRLTSEVRDVVCR